MAKTDFSSFGFDSRGSGFVSIQVTRSFLGGLLSDAISLKIEKLITANFES